MPATIGDMEPLRPLRHDWMPLASPIQAQGVGVGSVVTECPSEILRRARASAQETASLRTMAARPVTAGQDRRCLSDAYPIKRAL
jgi:hypothetical protein